MPRNLMTFGLGLIAAWVLLKVASFVLGIALWVGLILVIVGAIWHLLEGSVKRT